MSWKANILAGALTTALGLVSGCSATGVQSLRTAKHVVGPVTETGALQDVPYRVDIPQNWNGELVMLLHGYEPKGVPRATPWPQNEAAPQFLAKGYAVAASAYASQGWSVADAVPDNEHLRAYFAGKYGAPSRTYLVGFSLGGYVALASLEKFGARYSGALSLCGVNVPATTAFNEAVVTSLVAFDYWFPDALGLAPGGLADPASPPMVDPEVLEAALQKNETAAEALSRRLEVVRPALAGALMLNYLVLREMQTRAGGFPVDNRATVYAGFGDDVAFNRGARRYAGDAMAMRYLAEQSNLTGRISKPVVIQSNNDDPTVPKRFNSIYPALVTAAGDANDLAVLPSTGEGHCGFSPEQTSAAFTALTDWIEKGRRPATQ
ncbi:MAG: hypothetical protein ABI451_08675 [Dokdonella sp.]